jgi:cytochrome o ubiquinol oxidase subunit II
MLAAFCAAVDGRVCGAAGRIDLSVPARADRRHPARALIEVVAILMVVVLPVLILTPLFAWHFRYTNRSATYRPRWSFSWRSKSWSGACRLRS